MLDLYARHARGPRHAMHLCSLHEILQRADLSVCQPTETIEHEAVIPQTSLQAESQSMELKLRLWQIVDALIRRQEAAGGPAFDASPLANVRRAQHVWCSTSCAPVECMQLQSTAACNWSLQHLPHLRRVEFVCLPCNACQNSVTGKVGTAGHCGNEQRQPSALQDTKPRDCQALEDPARALPRTRGHCCGGGQGCGSCHGATVSV